MRKVKALLFTSLLLLMGAIYFKSYQIAVEKENEFVSHGLIRMGAIYTLLGDKPVSTFACYAIDDDTEDIEIEVTENDIVLDKSKVKFTKDNFYRYEKFPELWKSWQKRHKLYGRNFVLVSREGEEFTLITLVNKRCVRNVIEMYYQQMVQSLGI